MRGILKISCNPNYWNVFLNLSKFTKVILYLRTKGVENKRKINNKIPNQGKMKAILKREERRYRKEKKREARERERRRGKLELRE